MIPLKAVTEELEWAIAGGSRHRCAEILDGLTELFAAQAATFSEAEINVFDELLTRLTVEIEVTARAIMAVRLAPIRNAPPRTIRKLAFDDAIEVAAPVLSQSERLTDEDLAENASCKSQEHLLAIAGRTVLNELVTDVLIARGDRRVLLDTARNKGAKFSNLGFSVLVRRAEDDNELSICVGSRTEIPPDLFRKLITKASKVVRERLAASHPEALEHIDDIVSEAAQQVADNTVGHTRGLPEKQGPLGQSAINAGLASNDLAQVALALAASCNMPTEFVEQAVRQRSVETFLILARAVDLSIARLREILQLREKGRANINEIEKIVVAYRRLKIETAEEILGFYRTRAKGSRGS